MDAAMRPPSAETLLMVDDEPLMTDLFRQFMSKRGYRVLTASGGREALALVEVEVNTIDLIITDMTMPDMSGMELVQTLAERFPDIPVIIVTGHSTDVTDGSLPVNVLGVVQKPYQNRRLEERIREILDVHKAG